MLAASPSVARADDAYCDHVEGVAAAQSAILFGPELFGSFGYVDQLSAVDVPSTTSDDLRITAGVKLSLGGVYEAIEGTRETHCDACFSGDYPLAGTAAAQAKDAFEHALPLARA